MSQVNKWKLNDLIKNLKNNKDAVVIIGDRAIKELELFPINEASKEVLNKKNMVRNPGEFWKYYEENILPSKPYSEAEKELLEMMKTGVLKTVIDLNYTGHITKSAEGKHVIQLKGDQSFYRCMSCGKEGIYTSDMLNTSTMLKCDCKGKISPTITMFGDKYLEKNIQAVKDAIFIEDGEEVKLNTHCLIFVGVDFQEDYINELIDSYDAIKGQVTTDEDPYFTVIITDGDWASIEYYQPEFATDKDIADSIKRLTAQIKED